MPVHRPSSTAANAVRRQTARADGLHVRPISIPFFIPFALMSFGAARIVWSAGILVALYLVIMLRFPGAGPASDVAICG